MTATTPREIAPASASMGKTADVEEIAIVGGGIGGLTAAVALRQAGREARVFEAADAFRTIGAGIWMPPNAMQVFDRLGLADEVEEEGVPVRRAQVRDHRGRLLTSVELAHLRERYGCGTVAIHRGRLHRVLARHAGAETVVLGKCCEGVEVDRRSGSSGHGAPGATLRFADGTSVRTDLVIGADGLHSVVRKAVVPDARLRATGQVAVRGISRVPLPPALHGVSTEYWGPGLRFGIVSVSPGESYWWCAFDSEEFPEGADPSAGWLEETAERFPEPVAEVVEGTVAEERIVTPLSDLQPLSRWFRGPVVVLGDAAHAMTPNLGQGGAQAVEDAWILAGLLGGRARRPTVEMLEEYEALRRRKADLLLRMSRWTGKAAHLRSRLGRGARNLLLRLTPQWVEERQARAVYDIASLP